MLTITEEQEHYCLVTDGTAWAVTERRAGRYYPLGDCGRPGVRLEQAEASCLMAEGRRYSESEARRALSAVATQWRHLAEVVR
jgi:hypothetical protein